jgi:tetratricopeptide (TPR) repeat protein
MTTIQDISVLLEADDERGATKSALRAISENPADVVFLYDVAGMFLDHDNIAGALKLLRNGIERHGEDARIMERYGRALLANADLDESEKWFRDALAAYPESDGAARSRCWTGIGEALMNGSDPEGAVHAWREALGLDPTNQDAAMSLELSADPYEQRVAVRNASPEFQEFMAVQLAQSNEAGAFGGSPTEAERWEIQDVLGSIYDEYVHSLGESFEAMTPEERTEFFQSIDPDWPTVQDAVGRAVARQEAADDTAAIVDADTLKELTTLHDYGFLLPGEMRNAMYARSALDATGLEGGRIAHIIVHGDANEEEQLLFQWAAAIGGEVLAWVQSGADADASEHYENAVTLVRGRVEKDEVVEDIITRSARAVGNL